MTKLVFVGFFFLFTSQRFLSKSHLVYKHSCPYLSKKTISNLSSSEMINKIGGGIYTHGCGNLKNCTQNQNTALVIKPVLPEMNCNVT
jgi:hypothetical protein